ncbi:Sphingosine N-acyltransferase lag1 [Taxawa tesnikishii (nom. ined.)]|nr:Sphingosine N-acyltransferase lag1 [Dothideales sp. JES 119]
MDSAYCGNDMQRQTRAPQSRKGDIYNVATCSNPGTLQRSRKPRKDESLGDLLRTTIVKHQLGLSINLVLLLAFTHLLFPSLRTNTSKFFSLSYLDPQSGLYTQGWDDLRFVAFWIVIFTGLRAGTMDYILIPYAQWAGIHKRKAKIRFAEQAWLLIYYAVFSPLGMYLVYRSDYFFNLPEMWADFPTRTMTGLFKWYYLVQFAFWVQQIVVVNIEEKRKDYSQMFSHHIITCLLMFWSYGYYQTKVGNVILCIMDVVDIVLPVAKMLKYGGYQTACDIAFGVFIVTWFVARHVFYIFVCWSIWAHVANTVMPYGCYDSVTGAKLSSDGGHEIMSNVLHAYVNNGDQVCFNPQIRFAFLGLLLGLQAITILWFGMICRVAYRVLSGQGADDTRSDDEGEDEAESEDSHVDQRDQIKDFSQKQPELDVRSKPVEEDVGVEELRFSKRQSPRRKKNKSRASGISIPGHADRKELLGRIGCDKPS